MTGDQSDILSRIKALLPANWFKGSTPILDGTLSGTSAALAQVYGLAAYARLQTRLATATDGFLDLISYDFFGDFLPRKGGEADAAFRLRIQAELLLERGTRKGMITALTLLTGRAPVVFEPSRPQDTGCYNSTGFYNYAGNYGATLPFQTFLIAYRPYVQSYGNLSAYNKSYYGKANYTNYSLIAGAVSDQDILNTIDAVKPAGTIVWVNIQN